MGSHLHFLLGHAGPDGFNNSKADAQRANKHYFPVCFYVSETDQGPNMRGSVRAYLAHWSPGADHHLRTPV